MAKEISSSNSSLPLHEVLEAEFKALHGELPPNYPTSGEGEVRLKALWAAVHGLNEKRSALCISGGGIRSATFGLGILQGLAGCGLLDKFHYLSTVSGGGYIGSWLSAWIKNHPQGIGGVVAELKRRPYPALNPDPQPIRHLREFSNYLTPKTGLTSVDFWTLITTFIRNMFLNWLVLISLLGAVMMIPRFYLVAITLAPNWRKLGWDHYLKVQDKQPDWGPWVNSVKQPWDKGLTILLAVGFALVAVAMAYAIIDVPSTGNARYSQRRFLWFRQLPLLLASLILTEWWAVFRNVHGSEPFQPADWFLQIFIEFIGFTVASYLCGGLLAIVIHSFHKREHKARPGRLRRSLWRLGTIVATAAFAGFCLWAMATRLFLGPSGREFELKSECAAILIPSLQEVRLSAGAQVGKILGKGGASLKNEYTFRRKHALFATEDLDALEPILVPAPADHALNYVCFAPALFLAVLLLVNFLFTGLASWVTRDADREWWGRSAAWILITIVGWIVFNVIALWGAQAITATTTENQLQVFFGQVKDSPTAKALLGAFGGVTGLAGALLALRSKLGNKLGQKGGFNWLLVVVAVVFFVLLSVVISWALLVISSQPWVQRIATRSLGEWPTWQGERLFVIACLTGITLFSGIVMGFFINANRFSLHAIYRNRLIRAYLAASRTKNTRKPHLFTGFDPDDDFELHKLPSEKPLHVINGALNLVTWQGVGMAGAEG